MNNPENRHELKIPEVEGRSRNFKRNLAVGAMALVSVTAGIVSIVQPFDKTGKTGAYEPAKPLNPKVDNTFSVASWNMQSSATGHIEDIREIIRENEIDAMALQEVEPAQVGSLRDSFPRLYFSYVLADGRSKPAGGGNHTNVWMTRQKPKNLSTYKIEGTGNLESITARARGIIVDVASASDYVAGAEDDRPPPRIFENTKDSVQEHRAALALTVQAGKENKKDIRLITGHIAGLEVIHEEQREELLKFIKDNMKSDRPLVFCGDLNSTQREIIPRFARLGGFIVERTGSTSKSGKTLDYCAYHEARFLGLGRTTVLKEYMTDHHPIITKWHITHKD